MPAREYTGLVILCQTSKWGWHDPIIKAYGFTYGVRSVLKSLGFWWDFDEHAWIRPAVKNITTKGVEYYTLDELRKPLEGAVALVVTGSGPDFCPEFGTLIPRVAYAVELPNGSLLITNADVTALVDLKNSAVKGAPEPIGFLIGRYGIYSVGEGEALVVNYNGAGYVYRNALAYDSEGAFVLEELKEPIEEVAKKLQKAFEKHACYRDCTADCNDDCGDLAGDEYDKCLSECSEACWNACRNA